MIEAEIEWKNGKVENRTFHDSGEYVRFIDKHHAEIKIVTADDIRPCKLRQGRCDIVKKDIYI